MRHIFKSFTFIAVLVFAAYFQFAFAYPEECDGDGYIIGTNCSCFDEPGAISICGNIGRAGIEKVSQYKTVTNKDVYMTLRPVENVVVSIRENNPEYPGTVGPFGDFDSEYGYCNTNSQGNFACKVRQIVPGYNVWVVASCNGKIAWMKNVPSFRSIKNLDMDVNCGDGLTVDPLPAALSFAKRDQFLGCTFTESDLDVGFGDGADPVVQEQYEYTANTNVGIVNYDSRYVPFEGLDLGFAGISIGAHPGAFWNPDCVWQYGDGSNPDTNYECNISGAMEELDKATRSFLKFIPDELVEKAYRRFENRISHQREIADPANPARANHLLFGDCVGSISMRYFQQVETDERISCEEIKKCKDAVGDPYRNVQTAFSILSRSASPISFMRMFLNPERETTGEEGIACRTSAGEDVTIAEIQPTQPIFRQSSCEPGSAGCIYKLSSNYYMPQFFMLAGSGKKPYSYETWNDAYGKRGMKIEQPWELGVNEAEEAHWSGDKVVYDEGKEKNNSVLTMARLVTNTLGNSDEVMGHTLFSPIDAKNPNFEPPTDTTYWDVGTDLQSLCTLSAADLNINNGVELSEETVDLAVNNTFIGGHDPHIKDKGAGTSTYGTNVAIFRDTRLRENIEFSTDDSIFKNMWIRDLFDTAMTISEGGTLQDFTLLGALPELYTTLATRGDLANVYKSYAERIDNWNQGLPNEEMEVSHCIAQENFETVFPVFGGLGVQNGYPGDAGGCYPWVPLKDGEGEKCNVHPGPGNDPVGELRTCKVTGCQEWIKESVCRLTDPLTGDCLSWRIREDKYMCDNDAALIRECLREQEDTWGVEPPDPDDGETERVLNCDLERAGPMRMPSGLAREQATNIKQEPLPNNPFQADARNVTKVTNHLNLSFSSPVEPKPNMPAMSFNDAQTTNNLDGEGLAARYSAGIPAQALGMGATTAVMKRVAHPVKTTIIMDTFDPFVQTCSSAECPTVAPPPPIPIESLPDGGVCTPAAQGGSCPISVSEEMEIVMGAAGARAGVPGSLILAAMWPEGAFGGGFPEATFANKWEWTGQNVTDWSENWYDMMPFCNPSHWTAEGPFGLITKWFNLAVQQGGYHPDRVSPTNGEPIVQKCNLIDAAYAAAQMLKNNSNGTCGDWSEAEAIDALKVYRGGSNPVQTQIDIFNRCR